MLILGMNGGHNASAALLADGEVVAAAEEERFTRVKHQTGLPVEAARWVLADAGVKASQLDHVASSFDPHAHSAFQQAELEAELEDCEPDERQEVVDEEAKGRAEAASRTLRLGAAMDGGLADDCGLHNVEHHPAHIASAFFASPFEDAALFSVDGLGDCVSTAWGTGRGNNISVDHRVFYPHSLGMFYHSISRYLGFPYIFDEYKVMGLAPYGTPRYLPEMRRVLLSDGTDFRVDLKYFTWAEFEEPPFTSAFEDLLGPARTPTAPLEQRHRDIAASAQVRLEEVLLPMLERLHRTTGLPDLAMAGGVALNVTCNTKILDATGFESVFIQPAASDEGTSIGSALYVAHQTLGEARAYEMFHAYLGPRFSSDACAASAERAGLGWERLEEDELCRRTAELISRGAIVGWFQGRMEFGPRALGNRSILCDPRNPQMKDIVNTRTKRRESFRPFAPSVLAERADEIYDVAHPSPFMLFAPAVRPDWRDRLPAVTHVDGTGRVQTVSRETNGRYWKLLRAFEKLTGVPVLLNTSFNENEPIVCTPEEAIACFLRADMDVLVLEDLLLTNPALSS